MKGTYKINKNIIFQKLDTKLVGLDTNRSTIHTFNKTAEHIFKKIKLGWDEEKISAFLAKKYDAPLLTLKKDVKVLIKEMIKNKIISSALS